MFGSKKIKELQNEVMYLKRHIDRIENESTTQRYKILEMEKIIVSINSKLLEKEEKSKINQKDIGYSLEDKIRTHKKTIIKQNNYSAPTDQSTFSINPLISLEAMNIIQETQIDRKELEQSSSSDYQSSTGSSTDYSSYSSDSSSDSSSSW